MRDLGRSECPGRPMAKHCAERSQDELLSRSDHVKPPWLGRLLDLRLILL